MGKPIAATANFIVYPAITVTSQEIVFGDEVIRDISEFDADIFGIRHGGVEIEVLDVYGAEAGPLSGEDAVEEKLDELKGGCVGAHIPRVADPAATNGDPSAIRIIFFRADFTDDHGVADLLTLVGRDVLVVNEEEGIGASNTLARWCITNANSLAEAAQFVSIGGVPCGLVAGIATQLAMFEEFPSGWIKHREGGRAIHLFEGRTEIGKAC